MCPSTSRLRKARRAGAGPHPAQPLEPSTTPSSRFSGYGPTSAGTWTHLGRPRNHVTTRASSTTHPGRLELPRPGLLAPPASHARPGSGDASCRSPGPCPSEPPEEETEAPAPARAEGWPLGWWSPGVSPQSFAISTPPRRCRRRLGHTHRLPTGLETSAAGWCLGLREHVSRLSRRWGVRREARDQVAEPGPARPRSAERNSRSRP